MKPPLSVFAHVQILTAKVVNHAALFINVRPLRACPSPAYPLWLIVLLLSSSSFARGTAIFLVRTPNEIVAAADSRAVSGNDIPDPEPICKIRRFGAAYIAVNGMYKDPPSGYEVFSILKAASERKGVLTDKISAFEAMVKAPLEKALNRLRREEPVAFQRNAIEIAPLGVNFFGVERGVLALYNRRFIVSLSANNEVSVIIERRACPGADCPTGAALVTVGANGYKERFEKENPNYMKGSLVAAARRFIQMQIDAKDPSVGPPIDILRITKDGAQWDGKEDEECPKTQRPATPTPPSRPTKPKRGRRRPR